MVEHENTLAVRQDNIDGLEPSYDASGIVSLVWWR
jgi:hypothetical protein